MPVNYRYKLRRGTAAEWADANPVLALTEPGVLIDGSGGFLGLKMGDGSTPWSSLPLAVDAETATQAAIDALTTALSAETASRTSADATLTANVATNTSSIATNAAAIAAETTARTSGDSTNATAIAAETTRATAAEALKAPLASPALTGTPTAPTAAPGSNTTQIATTAHVLAAINALVNAAPGTLDTLKELADALGDDPNFATTITNALALKAPLASPALTGVPTVPTASAGTTTTQAASTAFVAALGATKAQALTPTAVKTANYTAAAGELVVCDLTGGSFTVNLPLAPADATRVAIKIVLPTTATANALTIACGGSDVINRSGGVTSYTFAPSGTNTPAGMAQSLQYKASGAIWYVVADDLPLSQLDARYQATIPTGTYALGLVETAVKTADYTAAPKDFVLMDATAANRSVPLPAAPPNQTRIGVMMVATASSHTVSVVCSGSDHFNISTGATSYSIALLNQAVIFQYVTATATWTVQVVTLPLAQLDSRYAGAANAVVANPTTNNVVGGPGALPSPGVNDIRNVAIGDRALNERGGPVIGNVAIGPLQAMGTTNGSYNVALGWSCLGGAESGNWGPYGVPWDGVSTPAPPAVQDYNVAIGYNCLIVGQTASRNVAIGQSALVSLSTGTDNVGIGTNGGSGYSSGVGNICIGYHTGEFGTTGGKNVLIGYTAGQNMTTPSSQVAVGDSALKACTTGINNTAVGKAALTALTTAGGNTAVGVNAQAATTTGGNQVGVGQSALATVTTGSNNVAVGQNADTTLATLVNGTIVGQSARVNANEGTALGQGTTVGHTRSVALGRSSTTTAVDQIAVKDRHIEFSVIVSFPAAGAAGTGRLGLRDNGAGKMQLAVQFPSGAVQAIATEP